MTDWRQRLPVLSNGALSLRELRMSDAEALLDLLSTEEVSRFISPPPTSVDGFERFIAWAQRERVAGRYVCFAVVPDGMDTAIGIFQVRQLDPTFSTAEWGFAIGRAFWGTGVFTAAARLTIDFAFDVAGVHRLEARAATVNGRGNGALAKIGAVKEAVLRRSFLRADGTTTRHCGRSSAKTGGARRPSGELRFIDGAYFSTHRLRSGGSTKSSECDHFRGSEGIQRTGSNVFSTA